MQSVSIFQIGMTASLQVGCTFVKDTLAMGCELTVCKTGDEMCTDFRLSPANPATILSNIEPGTYTITQVAEIEQDLRKVVIRSDVPLGTLEATLSLSGPVSTTVMGGSNSKCMICINFSGMFTEFSVFRQ